MAGVLWQVRPSIIVPFYWCSDSLIQSLVTGRPPALLTAYIDCRIPTAEDEFIFQQGEVPLGCEYYRVFRFLQPDF